MPAVIQLPLRPDQTAFNLERWDEVLNDPYFAGIEGQIETDRHGQVVMSPPPSRFHGRRQAKIVGALLQLLSNGEIVTECPISTEDGVKAADVTWLSPERSEQTKDQACLTIAPEICVEIVSPSNSVEALREKTALYFAAGAKEVWWCQRDGMMRFYSSPDRQIEASEICPAFPRRIEA